MEGDLRLRVCEKIVEGIEMRVAEWWRNQAIYRNPGMRHEDRVPDEGLNLVRRMGGKPEVLYSPFERGLGVYAEVGVEVINTGMPVEAIGGVLYLVDELEGPKQVVVYEAAVVGR